MRKYDDFFYPSFLNDCATVIGKKRTELNKQLRKDNTQFERGEINEQCDILGVKAELIFGYYLFTNGITYRIAPLLTDHPVSSWDFQIKGWNIDVKGMNPDYDKMMVNEEAHQKAKDIHYYVFLQVTAEQEYRSTARFWIIPWNAVNEWNVEFAGFSNAYVMELSIILEAFKNYDGTTKTDKETG
jgi:hypothetical protein